MKALLVVLLLAGIAWGGDFYVCGNEGKAIIDMGDHAIISNCPIPEKGHCPHCGAKGTKWGELLKDNYTWYKDGAILFLCPNGHMFWEKD